MPKIGSAPSVAVPTGQPANPHARFSSVSKSAAARPGVAAGGAPLAADSPRVDHDRLRRWLEACVEFVTRRRVPISIILFGGLAIEDLLTGMIPHDILDPRDPKSLCGLLAVLIGLALRSWAAGFLIKDTQLTTGGPYALVRNPLYLGSFLMIAGFCVLIDDPENMWILPGALLLIYWPKILREEQGLARRYPEAWQHYARSTSRLLPRLNRMPQLHGWLVSQWMKSREYKAVLATTAALAGLKLLRVWHLG